jgi:hypothetical protein
LILYLLMARRRSNFIRQMKPLAIALKSLINALL